MSDTKQESELEAIERNAITEILADNNGMMDYADVVNAVHRRFRLDVTAVQVEQVVHELADKKVTAKPRTTIGLEMTSIIPGKESPTEAAQSESATPASGSTTERPMDDLDHALNFVKSVGGLAKARRALDDLESALLGISD